MSEDKAFLCKSCVFLAPCGKSRPSLLGVCNFEPHPMPKWMHNFLESDAVSEWCEIDTHSPVTQCDAFWAKS